jgi:glycosyltransferase involved in cell wall biosynthesis
MPRLLFFCPDIPTPTGGIQIIYRHVDLLNAAGIDAVVVHQRPGFELTWFEHETAVDYVPSVEIGASDVLVAPEIVAHEIVPQMRGVAKVIFNQNPYYTFNPYPVDEPVTETVYGDPDLLGVVVVSEDSRDYVTYAFPQVTVRRIWYSIDPNLFHPEPDRAWRIAFMPRKNAQDVRQVLHLLSARGVLDGVELVALNDLPRSEVARALRQTLMFLSFGYPEGFGLPAAEAMACSCVTVGYHGMGGAEFLRPPHAFPVAFGDIVGYAREVERLLDELRDAPERLLAQAEGAAAFIAETYSEEHERESVIACWSSFLAEASAARSAKRRRAR